MASLTKFQSGAADGRPGAEDRELQVGVFRFSPVRVVVEEDQHRADERAEHLARPSTRGPGPSVIAAVHRDGERHGRVEVGAADRPSDDDADRTQRTPTPIVMTIQPEFWAFDL